MDGKFKPGDPVTFKKLADKKIIQVDNEKQEALCEGVNKKNEKKTVWIPLRLLKLRKQEDAAQPGASTGA
jgi:hypothetical protein